MDYIKTSALGVTLLLLLTSVAGARESLWRVHNDGDAEIVPSYTGSPTVFPVKAPPVVKRPVIIKREVSPEERRRMQAAAILKEIREAMESTDIFSPDVSNVKVEAKINGNQGKSILINNHWLSKDDEVVVPATATDAIYELVADLESVNTDLAASIEEEVNKKVARAGVLNLKVNSITDDSVELLDNKGSRHVIFLLLLAGELSHKYTHTLGNLGRV